MSLDLYRQNSTAIDSIPTFDGSKVGTGVGWFHEYKVAIDQGHRIQTGWLAGTGTFQTYWYKSWRYKDTVLPLAESNANYRSGRQVNPAWRPEPLLPATVKMRNRLTGDAQDIDIVKSLAFALNAVIEPGFDAYYRGYAQQRLKGIATNGVLKPWGEVVTPPDVLDLASKFTEGAEEYFKYNIYGMPHEGTVWGSTGVWGIAGEATTREGQGIPWMVSNPNPVDGRYEACHFIADDVIEFLGSRVGSPCYAPYQTIKKWSFDLIERFNSDPAYKAFVQHEAYSLHRQHYNAMYNKNPHWYHTDRWLRHNGDDWTYTIENDSPGYSKYDYDRVPVDFLVGKYENSAVSTALVDTAVAPSSTSTLSQTTTQTSELSSILQQATDIEQSGEAFLDYVTTSTTNVEGMTTEEKAKAAGF